MTLSATARQAVKNSNRVSAQSALKSKKIAESTLSHRSATLHQLEEVYAKLEQAVDQVEVVRVMEASATTLKSLNKQIGGVERVEDVIEDLREEMGKVDEVSGVIKEPLNDQAVIDEGELDDELEALEREEKDKQEEKQAEERKKQEEKQAEEMKKRLEEAGKLPEGPVKTAPEQKEDDAVENAAKRLSGMSIEELDKRQESESARSLEKQEAETAQ